MKREIPDLSAFFSSDGSFSLQFAIIFVVIFLVLAGGVFLLRRFTGQGAAASSRTGLRGRQPRLGIVDIYELDRQRQLILLRRDNVEHLLLVGGPNDVVVERNITRGINARLANEEAAYDDAPEPVPVAGTMPPAPVESPPLQEPPIQHLAEPFPPRPGPAPYLEPSFAMPVVVPAPVPGSDARPEPAGRPLDLSAQDEDEPRVTPEAAPTRAKDSPIARAIRRTPPSLANLVPAALADRFRPPERTPEPEATPPQGPEALPPAPVLTPTAARGIDAAILSDMARQLEEALRRPSTAVRPAVPAAQAPAAAPAPGTEDQAEPLVADAGTPGPTFETAPAPIVADAHAVDPVAAAMAEAARQPLSPSPERENAAHDALFADTPADDLPPVSPVKPESAASEPVFLEAPTHAPEPTVVEERVVPERIEEVPVVHATVADAPQVEALPAPTEPDPPPFVAPAPQPPTPKPAASPNPFSVEEIEAEFARLLGRPLDRKQ